MKKIQQLAPIDKFVPEDRLKSLYNICVSISLNYVVVYVLCM